ncbi:MAG TPA: DUF4397 domain-containing protein [Gammaproteobacteria bacterium]|nr:DUF4397 domain-containing protein [Gammaproteobacteria bacterium]
MQVANAAAGFPSLSFRREQESSGQADLQFKDAQSFLYDADTYDFYVQEPTLAREDPGRTWTFARTLEEKIHYTFVLTEAAGEVVPVVMTSPEPPATNAQVLALHAATDLPAFDLYLERAGVGIAGATPRGTLNAGEQIAPTTLPSGDYELFVTAAGNPADVWLSSTAFTLVDGSSSTFVIVDQKGLGTARIHILALLQGASTVLLDRNAPSELRVINGAPDKLPRDVAVESQFSPPLFSATAFAVQTPYAQVPIGSFKVNVTPPGNPGVLEIDTTTTGVVGQQTTMMFSSASGTLLPTFATDDGRRFNRAGTIRFMNAASQFLAVNFVLTFPGDDPLASFPLATLFTPGISPYTTLHPGEYDLYLLEGVNFTTLKGPTRINVAAGGIYSVLAIDGPDTATADAVFLDDPQ